MAHEPHKKEFYESQVHELERALHGKREAPPAPSARAQELLKTGAIKPVPTKHLERFERRAATYAKQAQVAHDALAPAHAEAMKHLDHVESLVKGLGGRTSFSATNQALHNATSILRGKVAGTYYNDRGESAAPKRSIAKAVGTPEELRAQLKVAAPRAAAAMKALGALHEQHAEALQTLGSRTGASLSKAQAEPTQLNATGNPKNVSKALRKDFDAGVKKHWGKSWQSINPAHANDAFDLADRQAYRIHQRDNLKPDDLGHPAGGPHPKEANHPYLEARREASAVNAHEGHRRDNIGFSDHRYDVPALKKAGASVAKAGAAVLEHAKNYK